MLDLEKSVTVSSEAFAERWISEYKRNFTPDEKVMYSFKREKELMRVTKETAPSLDAEFEKRMVDARKKLVSAINDLEMAFTTREKAILAHIMYRAKHTPT